MLKLSTNEIKLIKSLAQKKFRDESGLFIVEGEKMLSEAMESGFELVNSYYLEQIGPQQMSRISSLSSPSPCLAVLRIPKSDFEEKNLKKDGLYLALDSVRDPGNLGTIMRICDWFGVDGIFASEDSVDQFNPKVVQSSMGAIFRKTIHYVNLKKVCSLFTKESLPIYGTFLDGNNFYSTEFKPHGLIVMGNESRGISKEMADLCTHRVFIPSFSNGAHAESLHVAVASAVIISEFKKRQYYEK